MTRYAKAKRRQQALRATRAIAEDLAYRDSSSAGGGRAFLVVAGRTTRIDAEALRAELARGWRRKR